MNKGKLHHVEIYVSCLKKSRMFWEWFLGELDYTLYQEWDAGFSMKLGETYIVFVETEKRFQDVSFHRCRTGLNHLAFHSDTKEFIDEIHSKIQKRDDVKILYAERYPNAGSPDGYSLFFEDPDRIKVELTL